VEFVFGFFGVLDFDFPLKEADVVEGNGFILHGSDGYCVFGDEMGGEQGVLFEDGHVVLVGLVFGVEINDFEWFGRDVLGRETDTYLRLFLRNTIVRIWK
jgi:hypothetical protein